MHPTASTAPKLMGYRPNAGTRAVERVAMGYASVMAAKRSHGATPASRGSHGTI
jgi:hypothetical protein